MSLEENKAIELRFFEEVVNKGNLAVIDEIVAANFVQPDATPGMLEDMFAEGDKVVQRFTARGTHKSEWMGIAPTGKQMTASGIAIHRITGGKIVEGWTSMDMLGQDCRRLDQHGHARRDGAAWCGSAAGASRRVIPVADSRNASK
jgi:predicted ester cyclase